MTRPVPGVITCDYGVKGSWAAGFHPGVDFRAPVGTPVVATFPAVVVGLGNVWGSDYGIQVVLQSRTKAGVEVQHGYCHLSRIRPGLVLGAHVAADDVIGWSGETGRTFGPHLHYEERKSPFRYNDRVRNPRFPLRTLAWIANRFRPKKRDHPKAGVPS